jgi:hypothetical protein
MTRLYLIKDVEDCKEINVFLKDLDRNRTEYEVDWEFEEGMPGILVTIEWEE